MKKTRQKWTSSRWKKLARGRHAKSAFILTERIRIGEGAPPFSATTSEKPNGSGEKSNQGYQRRGRRKPLAERGQDSRLAKNESLYEAHTEQVIEVEQQREYRGEVTRQIRGNGYSSLSSVQRRAEMTTRGPRSIETEVHDPLPGEDGSSSKKITEPSRVTGVARMTGY